MGIIDFIGKQFIDVIQWNEDADGVLAWRFPVADQEIQSGAVLTVRESQRALFMDEGEAADLFDPGRHILTTRTLPVLTNLRHWDKLFESPFKSDVYFFSTRSQVDQRWGTPMPVTLRDPEFGAVRVRAFGNYSYHLSDPRLFQARLCGTRERYTTADLDGQLRGKILQHLADAVAQSRIPFLDLAANQNELSALLVADLAPAFAAWGLVLETLTVQSLSLPDELQKLLDQRIGLSMAGPDMGRFMHYQAAQALPDMARAAASADGGSLAGSAMGLGAGVAMRQILGQQLQGIGQPPPGASAGIAAADILAVLERLGDLRAKGVITPAEFDAKKAELLRKLA